MATAEVLVALESEDVDIWSGGEPGGDLGARDLRG
jgi:hypothetical protein